MSTSSSMSGSGPKPFLLTERLMKSLPRPAGPRYSYGISGPRPIGGGKHADTESAFINDCLQLTPGDGQDF
jgi:hypothetical protein